ncbi:MAG: hypothetical protein CMB16_00360 [Euryarchaeota archaeon]|nr:hypothetical protein [Euryarchaeota archaeon]|tara:strand:+ start:8058 stop:10583 length:2526 start_codon:yes stop_codon:yes gene_type:complete
MAKASPAFHNFTAGELSPRLEGRTDVSKYFNGCSTLSNFVVHPHGGASRRSGTIFVTEVKNSSQNTRLIPFEFSVTQTYILEFGNQYFRIIKDGGLVIASTKTASGMTKANPVVVTSVAHGFSDGDNVRIKNTVGMTDVNNKEFVIANVTTDTFELQGIDGTNFGTYTSGGTLEKVAEVTTPYLENELDRIKFTQSADIMYLAHPSHPVQKIARTSHSDWSINQVDFRRGPVMDDNDNDDTLTASGRTGTVTINASADTFVSTDIGRLIKLHDGFVQITVFTNATTVQGVVKENEDRRAELMPSYSANTIQFFEGDPSGSNLEHNDRIVDTAAKFVEEGFEAGMKVTIAGASSATNNKTDALIVSVTQDTILFAPSVDLVNGAVGPAITITGNLDADNRFALGSFSATTGYPTCISFFEERLVFAGTNEQPQTIFFSVAGDFEDFKDGILSSSALNYTIGSNQVNVIRYLSAGRALLVGTTGGEFSVSSTDDAPISPTNTVIRRQSNYGSADIQPVSVGNVTLFVQRAKRKLRELVFDFNTDSYSAPDMTILAEHITESGIRTITYQQEPDNVVWCVLNNGKLCGMTYRREEEVVAWHNHDIAGTFTGVHALNSPTSQTYNYGIVESVAVLPSELDEDDLYIIVKRTIGGETKRFIERFNFFDFGSNILDAYFVDSGLTYFGSPTVSLSGLLHLEGQVVDIIADGSAHPQKTVTNGAVTLDRSSTNVHIGLKFDSVLKTMRVDAGGTEGTSQAKNKRIHDVTVRFFRSVGALVGSDPTNLDRIPFRSSADLMDKAVALFTGDKDIEFRGGYDSDGFITIKQDQALPLTVLALYPRLQTFDR